MNIGHKYWLSVYCMANELLTSELCSLHSDFNQLNWSLQADFVTMLWRKSYVFPCYVRHNGNCPHLPSQCKIFSLRLSMQSDTRTMRQKKKNKNTTKTAKCLPPAAVPLAFPSHLPPPSCPCRRLFIYLSAPQRVALEVSEWDSEWPAICRVHNDMEMLFTAAAVLLNWQEVEGTDCPRPILAARYAVICASG